jgi:transposase
MPGVGIDVSKDYVDLGHEGLVRRVGRSRPLMVRAFQTLPQGCRVALEPTSRYHRLVVEVARETGLDVKLVDTYRFSKYRESLDDRCSDDKRSALALARYAEKEWDSIREMPDDAPELVRLRDLISLRDKQVELRTAWRLSRTDVENLPPAVGEAQKAIGRSIEELEREILLIVGDDPYYRRFLAMDGVGEAIAPLLVWLMRTFRFTDSDQLVAMAGVDVRKRESGKFEGQRKLTKKGWGLIRKYGYCASNSLRYMPAFGLLFKRYEDRGFGAKATNMIVFRKILRAAFKIAVDGIEYDRSKFLGAGAFRAS